MGALQVRGASDARGQERQVEVPPSQSRGVPGVPSSAPQEGGALPSKLLPSHRAPRPGGGLGGAAWASQTPCPAWEPASSQPCEAQLCLIGLIRV